MVRTTQITDSIWVSGKCNIKSPMPIAPNSSKGSLGWRVSKEAVSLSIVAAANLDASGALSASVGLSQVMHPFLIFCLSLNLAPVETIHPRKTSTRHNLIKLI